MKLKYILLVFSVAFVSNVFADGENDIKGMFPYMAFIYYSDESVVDTTGGRFFRGAVLIMPDWLVTSAVQISDNANDVAFPKKTLLARLGAVAVDSKFTLNEDEDEQEREVIKIVRPYNHSATQWWRTDITLMQTLLPFNMTAAVATAPLYGVRTDKSCFILTYAKRYNQGNSSEDRMLAQTMVDLLPPSLSNCGSHFYEVTMTCSLDTDDKSPTSRDQLSACQSYKGGPLVCDSAVVGLQTYIDNCKAPHLYQLLSPWQKFIECATKNRCDQVECTDLCVVTNKDSPLVLETTMMISTPESTISQETTVTNVTTTQETISESTTESILASNETTKVQTYSTTMETTEVTQESPTSEFVPTSILAIETEPRRMAADPEKPPSSASTVSSTRSSNRSSTHSQVIPQNAKAQNSTNPKHWPKERASSMKTDEDDCDRNLTVEAHRVARERWVKENTQVYSSATETNVCLFQSVFCIFVLTNLI
ncbi:uncharacterized protein LOC128669331 [Plodia interpunctella]|uniref:uncharacterized protein LOC128669331 n=1 Tax=Plodia interpunctella TaxID=58824 RepID=UPI00236853F1|nr:uncharacterized protein LOC128669331 [Plodia interpunctella]